MKSSLPTVTVILYKSKTLANGEHPIMLRLCYNGQRNTLIRAEVDKANKKIMELERDKKDYSVTTLIIPHGVSYLANENKE